MVQLRQQLALELMREADVNTVQEIEREIFATPWPRNAYYRELASRASAHYVVLRQEGMVDEGGQRCGARIVVVTHQATDAALSETVAALADLDVVQSVNSVLRMEGTTE